MNCLVQIFFDAKTELKKTDKPEPLSSRNHGLACLSPQTTLGEIKGHEPWDRNLEGPYSNPNFLQRRKLRFRDMDQMPSLQGPLQNEHTGPLIQKAGITPFSFLLQSILACLGVFM